MTPSRFFFDKYRVIDSVPSKYFGGANNCVRFGALVCEPVTIRRPATSIRIGDTFQNGYGHLESAHDLIDCKIRATCNCLSGELQGVVCQRVGNRGGDLCPARLPFESSQRVGRSERRYVATRPWRRICADRITRSDFGFESRYGRRYDYENN